MVWAADIVPLVRPLPTFTPTARAALPSRHPSKARPPLEHREWSSTPDPFPRARWGPFSPQTSRRRTDVDLRNLVFGGAALGVLAARWEHLKPFSWRIAGMFIRRVEIPSEAAHQALIAYLVANYHRYRNYDNMYGADYEHHRDGRYGLVPYEQFGNRTVIFWNGWWPFV